MIEEASDRLFDSRKARAIERNKAAEKKIRLLLTPPPGRYIIN